MTLNYVAAFGKIKLVLYDDRKQRHFWRSTRNFSLNENHLLVSIPPYIWNGFTSADDNLAVLQIVQIFLMIKRKFLGWITTTQNFHTIGIKK